MAAVEGSREGREKWVPCPQKKERSKVRLTKDVKGKKRSYGQGGSFDHKTPPKDLHHEGKKKKRGLRFGEERGIGRLFVVKKDCPRRVR